MGYVEAVCISDRKGVVKKEVSNAELRESWGIIGDAHAGNWHRQVSLLAGESIDQVRQLMPDLLHGAFAENIITRGVDLKLIKISDRLRLGEAVILEVTQIGKKCHNACAIKETTGDCIMPKEGIFAKVVSAGVLYKDMPVTRLRNSDGH